VNWLRRAVRWAYATPATAHLLRAFDRYNARLGNQLAAAIAFFSVTAIVPVLMFAFSAVGLTLTVLRPEWLDSTKAFITANLNAGPLQEDVLFLVEDYLTNWRSVGLFAALLALFAGQGWIANVKGAIRALGRPDFDMTERRHTPLLEPLINVVLLLALLLLVGVTFAATVVGTHLAGRVADWLSVETISQGLVQGASFALSLVGATILFLLIFRFLPEEPAPRTAIVRGSLAAAVCFVVLQAAASLLTTMFTTNRATQIFGPVIVAMLFINVFARLILFFAAWIATWNQPAMARRYNPADAILRDRDDTVMAEYHWESADADRARRGIEPPADDTAVTEPDHVAEPDDTRRPGDDTTS